MLNMERIEVCALIDIIHPIETPEDVYSRVYRSFLPDAPPPDVEVSFRQFTGLRSSIRFQNGRLVVRISDLLERAPLAIMEALAFILVGKLVRQPVPPVYRHRYQRYLNRREVRSAAHEARQTRGRKLIEPPVGAHYDLDRLFDDLNQRFFEGRMAKPRLGWSRSPSRTTLGHYDPAHDAIVLSRLLDQTQVPKLAVEYVLFHEMLHLLHPADHSGARRRIHTKQFRSAEKQFPQLAEAKQLLRSL